MGWRFRKSISLGKGVRLNIGKKSLGISAGIKGARIGTGSRGAYSSFGIPGTGIYSINYLNKKSPKLNKTSSMTTNYNNQSFGLGCSAFIIGTIELILLFTIPPLGLILVIASFIALYFWNKSPKQKAKNMLNKARRLLDKNNFEESITMLNEAKKLDANNTIIDLVLGSALHDYGKYEDAIKYLKNYLYSDPNSLGTTIVLANCLYKTKQYKEAIEILQKLPDEQEVDLQVIQLLGACFAALKQYDLAISVFKKAPLQKRNLDEALKELHYNLGVIYEQSGDKNNALKHFKRVYAEDTNYRDVAEKII